MPVGRVRLAGRTVKAITYLPAVKEKGVDAALHVLIEDVG
mgnify:CR=1 FL=1